MLHLHIRAKRAKVKSYNLGKLILTFIINYVKCLFKWKEKACHITRNGKINLSTDKEELCRISITTD